MEGIRLKTSPFAKEPDTAFQQRRIWLIKRGYAELRQGGQKASIAIIYKRGYLNALEAEGFYHPTRHNEHWLRHK